MGNAVTKRESYLEVLKGEYNRDMRLVNQSYKTRRCVLEGKEEPPPSKGLVFNCIIDAHGSREEHGGGCCLKRWHCTIEQHKFTNCISREGASRQEVRGKKFLSDCLSYYYKYPGAIFRARQGLFYSLTCVNCSQTFQWTLGHL